jgi:hypothetical protein
MKGTRVKSFAIALAVLLAILAFVFSQSFTANEVLFANDAPLGALSCAAADMKTGLFGVWQDLNWLGIEMPSALPDTAAASWFLLGNNPVTFAKFHVPVALLALGLSFWLLLRVFGFHPAVCVIGAIAAALNMNIFSHAAWGLPSRAWTLASMFLALAALRSGTVRHPWLKAILAGAAVGNGIMEGFDVGAIFSLYVAAYAIFVPFSASGDPKRSLLVGIGRVAIVALAAAICAAAALATLVGTQIKGVAGMEQTADAKEKRWTEATIWSLPKIETLRVLVPGLFGYRMDTGEGGNYWGAVGQHPGVPQSRHSGAGEYAGALVVALAALGIASGFRRKESPWSPADRRTILFFAALALISLLFAWGRHAPFYRLVYSLPYFSTIRNPIKFMHPFHMSFLILFGYGLELIFRVYARESAAKAMGFVDTLKNWWKTGPQFERRWGTIALLCVAAALLATLIYMSSRRQLEQFLSTAGFGGALAPEIASFSFSEAWLAVLMLALAVGLVIAALTGWFSGPRIRLLIILLGGFLAFDLIHANSPWVMYYDYKEKYAANPVLDLLKREPYEHRMTAMKLPLHRDYLVSPQTEFFVNIANEWLQHHFQFYNVQSLEVVQFPRQPELDMQFYSGILARGQTNPAVLVRMWELSNTKYLMGDKAYITYLAEQLAPGRIKLVTAFDMAPKPGVTGNITSLDQVQWVLADSGRFGVFSIDSALPRGKLLTKWEKVTDDAQALARVLSPEFNPSELVLVNGEIASTPATTQSSTNDTVRVISYAPKEIRLETASETQAVLLWNDKYSPNWKAFVDGQAQPLLRCNFIMRGIQLPAGKHQVIMKYEPPVTGLYVTGFGMLAALGALGFVAVDSRKFRS